MKENKGRSVAPWLTAGFFCLDAPISEIGWNHNSVKKSSDNNIEKGSLKIAWMFLKLGRKCHLAKFQSSAGHGTALKRSS